MAPRIVASGVVALGLGVLTAYGQGWLPDEAASLANSVGSWSVAAFLLALLAPRLIPAVLTGAVVLLGLLAGYVLGADVRGYPSSSSLILFWGAASVTAGPALGAAAHWVRCGPPVLVAVGVGAVSGVLVGEGIHGLTAIADTTYGPYWWAQIGVGVLVLGASVGLRLRSIRPAALAVAVTGVVAAAFAAIYRLDLLAYF